MPLTFVPARIEDAEVLSELRRRVWATTYRGIYPDEMIDRFDYAFHNERNRRFIAAEQFLTYFIVEGSEKIGYLILRKGNPVHLQSLYLLEENRGRGAGTAAMAFVRSYCWEQGMTTFRLVCHPDNVRALGFYGRMGGVVIGRDEGHARNEENGVFMEFTV